jgi:hypothetical protein
MKILHLPLTLFALIVAIVGLPTNILAQDLFHPKLVENEVPSSSTNSNKQSIFSKYRKMNIVIDAPKDKFGNADGNKYDLVKDGAFKGLKIVILQLYTTSDFTFQKPTQALEQKGFEVQRWSSTPPSPTELKSALVSASQLWIISDKVRKLDSKHLEVIKDFFDSGKGIYIWGDNEPFYSDANYIAQVLVGTTMHGNLNGDEKVSL